MGEVWIGAAVTVVGGYVAGRARKKEKEGDQAFEKEMVRESARWNAALSAFEKEQEDYYNQLNRQRKERGLENFRQFSTVKTFAPGYTQSSGGIVVPDKPNAEAAFAEETETAASSGGSGSNLLRRRVDLHTKPLRALKDLF